MVAYDFRDINAKQARYWRDVGTLDAYYEANMDLVDVVPEFNLYDQRWPIRTKVTQQPPAKFVFAQEGRRMGVAVDSIVSAGCIVSGGRVLHSVLSPGVRVNSYCEVEYSDIDAGRGDRTVQPGAARHSEHWREASGIQRHRFRPGGRPGQGLSCHRERHGGGGLKGQGLFRGSAFNWPNTMIVVRQRTTR